MSTGSFNNYSFFWLVPDGKAKLRDIITTYRDFYEVYWAQAEDKEERLTDMEIVMLIDQWNDSFAKAKFEKGEYIGFQLRSRKAFKLNKKKSTKSSSSKSSKKKSSSSKKKDDAKKKTSTKKKEVTKKDDTKKKKTTKKK